MTSHSHLPHGITHTGVNTLGLTPNHWGQHSQH